MNFKLLSLLALASFVFAQESGTSTDSGAATPSDTTGATPSGTGAPNTGNLPPCIDACLAQAAQTAGCDPTSNACLCSAPFLGAAQTCVATSGCSPAEQQAALQMAQQICGTSASGSSAAISTTSSIRESATILPTSIASGTLIRPTTRPASTASASTSNRGSATGAPASATSTAGAITGAAAQGLWALAAGALGVAVAL